MQDLRDGGQSHALTLYRTVHVENGGTEVVRYVVAKSPAQRIVLQALRGSRLLRFLGHVATPSTVVVAVKG